MYALVTGATSGIGYELAKILAQNNYNLILVGRREDRLKDIEKELSDKHNIKVVGYKCDLADLTQIKSLIEFVKSYEDISVVINSAGYGKMGYLHEINENDDVDMITTNIISLHLINKHFSNTMKKGHIVNIASIAGTAPTPYMSQYGATKAYVYSFSRAINYEMKKLKKDVHVMVACPGPVDTEFHDRANSSFKLKSISASKCAQIIYKAMKKKKSKVMVSFPIKCAYVALKLAPSCITLPVEYKMQTKKNGI
ncbi:MAG: SDR family NAD(P)-dependent oxidoreductase [Lachnospiraceae bacterium]|nr:SDR family NAD(P)-dependent oxidoreductase [Lachnospiraceae bacterium]